MGELELQRGKDRLRIRRAGESRMRPRFAQRRQPLPHPYGGCRRARGRGRRRFPSRNPIRLLVKSPIVGTFYDAPSPGAPPSSRSAIQVEVGPGAVHHRVHEADE